MSIVYKLNNVFKQYGAKNLLPYAFQKAGEKFGYILDVYFLLSKDLSSLSPIKPLKEGFSARELTRDDLAGLENSWLSEREKKKFASRLEDPSIIGLGIFHTGKNELAYYFWLSTRFMEFSEHLQKIHGLVLEEEEAYLYDGYCHPDYRGNGLHGFAAAYLMNKAKEFGKKRAITAIRTINRAALISQEAVGFQRKKEIRFSGFGKNLQCRVRSL